jgi:hypothetical protein
MPVIPERSGTPLPALQFSSPVLPGFHASKDRVLPTPVDLSWRIPQLDDLRGVAVSMVVTFHSVTLSTRFGDTATASVLLRLVSFGLVGRGSVFRAFGISNRRNSDGRARLAK